MAFNLYQSTILIVIVNLLKTIAGEDLLELSCVDTMQCKQYEHPSLNVTCIEGHCRCTKMTNTTDTEFVKCAPINLMLSNIIGGHCPCTIPQTECNEKENVCYCAKEYIASTDRRRCIPARVAINDACESDAQCAATDTFAFCEKSNKNCQCRADFLAKNNKCFSILSNETVCSIDQNCGPNAICAAETQKCICEERYVKATNLTYCLPLASYHKNCSDNVQCQKQLGTGGACIAGVCDCMEKFTALNITKTEVICARITEIGQYCLNDTDCYQGDLTTDTQTMSCIFGECNCKWGYNSINNTVCVKGNHAARVGAAFFVELFFLGIIFMF